MTKWIKYQFILPLLFLANILFAQTNLLKNFLTVENGLSHNEVTSIVQDHDGFIWIGTRGGLNRYDGYEFKIFNQVPGDSNSLVNPSIERLFVDSKGNIWIGTKSGGISRFNPEKGEFRNFKTNYKEKSKILPDNRILSFHEDKKGQIWMGTWQNGVLVYNPENDSTIQFLSNRRIPTITETENGTIWVGSDLYLHKFENNNNIENYNVQGVCQEIIYDKKRNALWIVGGFNTGLRKFDLKKI